MLTKDDSVEFTVIDVLVVPTEEALAFPISGIAHVAPDVDAAAQISASVLGMIFTSYRVPSPKLIRCIPETPTD